MMGKLRKQVLALAMATALVFSLGIFASASEFADMPAKSHWAYEALNAATSNGLLKGDNNNKLNPSGNLKRGEMAAVINRAFGAAQTADISAFKDVSKSDWYYVDIAKAVKMGTFQGDGATMRPEADISRQEAFIVLARAIQLPAGDVENLTRFSDGALVAEWAKNEIAAMVAAGYVNGADGKLNPTETITRQEFAQVMYNIIKTYISQSETVTVVANGNVMVNVPGATLQDVIIKGDLIIGDGVGSGDCTLNNVQVEGRLVIRGGGTNSIVIKNGSSATSIVISKTADGGVRVVSDATSNVQTVYINDGNDSVIIEGNYTNVTVEGKTDIEIRGMVENVEIKPEATGTGVLVAEGAKVEKLESKAADVIIAGEGNITEAQISGNNTKVDVVGTKVIVDEGVEGTTVGDKPVDGGTEVIVEPPVTPPTEPPVTPTTYTVTLHIKDDDNATTDPSDITVKNVQGTEKLLPVIGMRLKDGGTGLYSAYAAAEYSSKLEAILLKGAEATGTNEQWNEFKALYVKNDLAIMDGYVGSVTLSDNLNAATVDTVIAKGVYTATLIVTKTADLSTVTYTVTITIV